MSQEIPNHTGSYTIVTESPKMRSEIYFLLYHLGSEFDPNLPYSKLGFSLWEDSDEVIF